MAMTQSEINSLINKINAGTYTKDDALADIAAAAKGRDVRAAIYALAYLNTGLSATAAEADQVPVADGNGGWAWGTVNGNAKPIYANAEATTNHTNITCTCDVNITSTASVVEG